MLHPLASQMNLPLLRFPLVQKGALVLCVRGPMLVSEMCYVISHRMTHVRILGALVILEVHVELPLDSSNLRRTVLTEACRCRGHVGLGGLLCVLCNHWKKLCAPV